MDIVSDTNAVYVGTGLLGEDGRGLRSSIGER